MIKKRAFVLIMIILVIAFVVIGILGFQKKQLTIVPKNNCDSANYIEQVHFEEDEVTLIGNFNLLGPEVFNKNGSIAYNAYNKDAILHLNQELIIRPTEECIIGFELFNLTREKAIIKYSERCAPPGPTEKKECLFEISRS